MPAGSPYPWSPHPRSAHLGSWTSALVDGQLDPATTERALAHVACCPRCAEEVALARDARRALSLAHDVAPAPDLTARLLALAAQDQPDAWPTTPSGGSFASPAPAHPWSGARIVGAVHAVHAVQGAPAGPTHPFPAGGMTGDVTRRRRSGVRVVIGSVAGMGVVAAALFALGEAPAVAPDEHPAQALTLLAQSASGGSGSGLGSSGTGSAGYAGAAMMAGLAVPDALVPDDQQTFLTWMNAHGWACPAGLPDGTSVRAVRLTGDGDGVLEIDLSTPHGQVVLTEQRGRLDTAALAGVEQVTFGDARAYVLSRAPWHLAWQSQDAVVELVSDAPVAQVEDVVKDFPADAYDDAAPARILRGWHTLTGAITGP